MIGICIFCKKDFRKRERKYKFCSLLCSSRFNRNGLKKIQLPPRSEKLAEFIGICLGDGCSRAYQTSVTLNSVADILYIPYVSNLIEELFPETKTSLVRRKDQAVDVRIYSQVIVNFLQKNGIVPKKKFIPPWIFTRKKYIQSCIRGLIDTEGSISFKEYQTQTTEHTYAQLNFRNSDIQLLSFVRDHLMSLGFKPTQSLKKYVYISNSKDIYKYQTIIGFGNPKLLEKANLLQAQQKIPAS